MEDEFRRGDVIVGRYELHEVVGSGAGGRIFLAFDRNLGGRETAVKFYEPDTLIADLAAHVRKGTISRDIYESELSNIYARFRQEAIRISRLDHPVIVKVFDYRDSEYEVETRGRRVLRNRPFLAMEFIKGMTVEERLAKDKLPLRDALEIGAQVADGLAYAHVQNLVHRDLKPSNIMIEDTPVGLRVRIIDWGVAKVVASEAQLNVTRIISTAEAAGGDDIHTRGILLGTPKFIAPEHFGSTGASWSPASDVFALGMFLFRLVTGQPVRRESYIGECLTQSDRELLRRASAHVPELANVVASCLSEVREERLTATAVRDALRRIQDRLTGTEATPGAPGQYPTPATRIAALAPAGEGIPTSALTSPAVPVDDGEAVDEEYAVPMRSGPGWMGTIIALVIGVGGGVGAATFMSHPPAPESANDTSAAAPTSTLNHHLGDTLQTAKPNGQGDGPLAVAGTAHGGAAPSDDDARGSSGTDGAGIAPPTMEADPHRVDISVRVTSFPPSDVSVRSADGFERLGRTPVDLKLKHRYEGRMLRFEPAVDAGSFNPLEQAVYALDYLSPEATMELKVQLPCANLFDPKCNDYSDRFEKAFDKEAGQ